MSAMYARHLALLLLVFVSVCDIILDYSSNKLNLMIVRKIYPRLIVVSQAS